MADDKEKTQRRVYVLPTELVERIVAYQEEMSLPSEVEAARRLLDSALQSRDTVENLLDRIRSRYAMERDLRVLATEILMPHQLVRSINFDDAGILTFDLSNGEKGRVALDGSTFTVSRHNYNGDEVERPYPLKGKVKVELDDEIPF